MDERLELAEPVTVVVTRRVKAGRERAYEAWLERLLQAAMVLPGYLGATVTRPTGTVVPQPSRWRMAVLMVIVVYGLVLSIGSVVGLALASWPAPARLLVTIIIEVALMTWVLMPRLTRWLARWIYPSSRVA